MWLTHLGEDTRAWHEAGEPRHISRPPAPVRAGDELGSFLLGSTVVMLLPAKAPAIAERAVDSVVRFGEALT